MAYPIGLLSLALEDIDRRLIEVKSQSQSVRAASASGPVAGSSLISLFGYLKTNRAGLLVSSAVSGLNTYAQAQKSNGSLDAVAEITAIVAAIDGVLNWLNANYPTSGGYLADRTWGPNGAIDRTFTTTDLAGLRTTLDTLIALIV